MCQSFHSVKPHTGIDPHLQPFPTAHITPGLVHYIQTEILPQYAHNDKGHQLEHIHYVIRRSLLFMEQFEDMNADMVYTIAAYHDIAHHIDKDRHEVLSAKALQNDTNLRHFFTEEQLVLMQEAIEDHRASLEYQPRSSYGKIVSSADRSTDIDGFIRRTHAYTRKHFPEYSEEQSMERCYRHMKSKYGNGSYARSYVIDDDYTLFIQTIQKLLDDKETFSAKYRAAAYEADNAIE